MIKKQKIDLNNVKLMHYLDYRLNNVPKYMHKYSGENYPRLVDYLFDVKFSAANFDRRQTKNKKDQLYRFLWREGLFRSCQA